jgi:hypothetical protein
MKQQHEVGSDISVLELLHSIDSQPQPITETAGIASGEIPHRPCVLEPNTVVDQLQTIRSLARDAPTL